MPSLLVASSPHWLNSKAALHRAVNQGKSGAHRHLYEEIEYVLSGKGYSIIEDQRYDWKKGDAFSIPMFGWHQHFNTGDETARFLVHTSRPGMENLGHVITQQGETYCD